MEQWKPVRQNNNYQVSNHGRVRTYNYLSNGKLLTLAQRNKGHKCFFVYAILCRNYSKKAYSVSRLVYEHFVGNVPKGYVVFNKDGNPWNNHVDNLVLMPRKDSVFVKRNHGRKTENRQSVEYKYYVDGVLVGNIHEFMKIVGERTHQNVSGRFNAWENRKRTTKWHRDDGVVFSGKLCTRTKLINDGKKYKRMQECMNKIKD